MPDVATVVAAEGEVNGLARVAYLIAPPLTLVAQKMYTLPLESTAPATSGGLVELVPLPSTISRELQVIVPELPIVPCQYVTPDQLAPFEPVTALNAWTSPELSSIAT